MLRSCINSYSCTQEWGQQYRLKELSYKLKEMFDTERKYIERDDLASLLVLFKFVSLIAFWSTMTINGCNNSERRRYPQKSI